jgi:hypothetical protein
MSFRDKELDINQKITIGDIIDNVCEMSNIDVFKFIVEIDERIEEHDFTMDLIIHLIKSMSVVFKSGDLIKIRSALTSVKINEGKQCSL